MRRRNPLSWYNVVSPVYSYMEDVCWGTGPTYEERDWLGVQAYTRREAVARAVKYWRLHNAGYLDEAENPYKGVVATLMCEEEVAAVEHGGKEYLPYEY